MMLYVLRKLSINWLTNSWPLSNCVISGQFSNKINIIKTLTTQLAVLLSIETAKTYLEYTSIIDKTQQKLPLTF